MPLLVAPFAEGTELLCNSCQAFSGAVSNAAPLSQPFQLPQAMLLSWRQVPLPAAEVTASELGQPAFQGDMLESQSSQHSTPSVSKITLSGLQLRPVSPSVGGSEPWKPSSKYSFAASSVPPSGV